MTIEKSVKKSVKVAVSLRADLVDWVDMKALEMGLSRSGYLAMCITQYKQALEVQPRLNNLMDSLVSLVNGYIDGSLSPEVAKLKLAELDVKYSDLSKK